MSTIQLTEKQTAAIKTIAASGHATIPAITFAVLRDAGLIEKYGDGAGRGKAIAALTEAGKRLAPTL